MISFKSVDDLHFSAYIDDVNVDEKFNLSRDLNGCKISRYKKILEQDGRVIEFTEPVISVAREDLSDIGGGVKLEVSLYLGLSADHPFEDGTYRNEGEGEMKELGDKLKAKMEEICKVKPVEGCSDNSVLIYSYKIPYRYSEYKRIIEEIEHLKI